MSAPQRTNELPPTYPPIEPSSSKSTDSPVIISMEKQDDVVLLAQTLHKLLLKLDAESKVPAETGNHMEVAVQAYSMIAMVGTFLASFTIAIMSHFTDILGESHQEDIQRIRGPWLYAIMLQLLAVGTATVYALFGYNQWYRTEASKSKESDSFGSLLISPITSAGIWLLLGIFLAVYITLHLYVLVDNDKKTIAQRLCWLGGPVLVVIATSFVLWRRRRRE